MKPLIIFDFSMFCDHGPVFAFPHCHRNCSFAMGAFSHNMADEFFSNVLEFIWKSKPPLLFLSSETNHPSKGVPFDVYFFEWFVCEIIDNIMQNHKQNENSKSITMGKRHNLHIDTNR